MLSLVLTYISGQVLIFWQEGQKSVQIDIAILENCKYLYNYNLFIYF